MGGPRIRIAFDRRSPSPSFLAHTQLSVELGCIYSPKPHWAHHIPLPPPGQQRVLRLFALHSKSEVRFLLYDQTTPLCLYLGQTTAKYGHSRVCKFIDPSVTRWFWGSCLGYLAVLDSTNRWLRSSIFLLGNKISRFLHVGLRKHQEL